MQPDPQSCVQADPYLSSAQFVHLVDTGSLAYGGLENMCVCVCANVIQQIQ